jgi:cobaltochelatase CobS
MPVQQANNVRGQNMATTLGLWTHPKNPADIRLYVNGFPGQQRDQRVYIDPTGEAHARGYDDNTADQLRLAVADWFAKTHGTFEVAMRSIVTPTPIHTPKIPMDTRRTLEESLIVQLAPAARMAGLAFKNGLSKAEIIERLMRNEALAQRAVECLESLRGGQTPERDAPKPDWLDDDAPVSPPPAPIPASEARAPLVDLSAYVRRPELQDYAKHSDVNSVRSQVITAKGDITALQTRVESLEHNAPVVISLPNKPEPVKVNGLRHEKFEDMLRALQAGVHVMLVGPAGSGKTYAAEQAAHALGLKYHKQPPVNYAHEILGSINPVSDKLVRTPTRDASEFGGLLNLDEFDASSADAGLACNQVADSSSYIAFPDGLIPKHRDFIIVCGTNTDGSGATMEYAGRARLDGATLNRFARIQWDYDPRLEDQMGAKHPAWIAAIRAIRAFAKQRGILDVVATMRDISTGSRLLDAGLSPSKVLEMTQQIGATRECWADILRIAAVSAFLKGE